MSKNSKIACVVGHFGFGHNLLNGQTVKTKIVTEELERRFPGQIMKIDTHGGIKSLLKAPFHMLRALKNSNNVLILPAHNGLRVYAPLLTFLRRFFRGRKLHYPVIGGWLASFLQSRRGLAKCLKTFDCIYVETRTMKRALEEMGFDNIEVMPNCKELTVLSPSELVYTDSEPYKLCTFSRVMKEKGIEDALCAVKAANEALGRTVYQLDIYGQVDQSQTEWFEELQKTFPPYVKYGGLVPFDRSVEVLKDYFALLFPTRFYTEGIPGTVIDAYAAGVPVISARWESFSDILEDGVTGIGYTFGNADELTAILKDHPALVEKLNALKENCTEQARRYLPETAIGILLERL